MKTAAMAVADRAVINDAKAADCLAQVAKASLADQGVTTMTAHQVSLKSYGSFSAAFELQASVGTGAQAEPVTFVEVFIQKGRAEISVAFVTSGAQPFDQPTGEAILAKLNARIKKAKI